MVLRNQAMVLLNHLPYQVCAQHDYIRSFVEALSGCQVANPFAGKLGVAHHFNDVESGPLNVVTQHLDLQETVHIA